MSAAVLQSESHADKETTLALGGAEGRDQSAENLCNLIVTPDHQKGNREAAQSITEGIPSESQLPAYSMAVQIGGVNMITVPTSQRRRLAKRRFWIAEVERFCAAAFDLATGKCPERVNREPSAAMEASRG